MAQPPNNHNPFDPNDPDNGQRPRGNGDGSNQGGEQPGGNGPGSTGGPGGAGQQGSDYPTFRPYPATPHPEDNTGFGAQGPGTGGAGYAGYGYGQQGAGNQGYGQPGYGHQGQPGVGGNGQGHVTGNGKVDVMLAVRWAFKTLFSNALIWILGTFVLFVVSVLVFSLISVVAFSTAGPETLAGMTAATSVFTLIVTAVTMVGAVFIYHGALHQVDKPKIGLGDFFRSLNFWQTIAVLLLVGAATWLISWLFGLVFPAPALPTDPTAVDAGAGMAQLAGVSLLGTLILLLIQPLHMYMVWYAVDGREGVIGAIVNGFKDGARNYLPLIAFLIVGTIAVLLAGIVTLGLALLILGPAWLLAQAHIYRQIAREPYPVA